MRGRETPSNQVRKSEVRAKTTSDWIIVAQTFILVGVLWFAYVQLRSLARSATSVAYQGLVELWAEYRRLFLQKPGLYGALFPQYSAEDNDETHLAKLLLDMIDKFAYSKIKAH